MEPELFPPSTPEPCALTVNVPFEYVALPAEPTVPISLSSHPAGRGCEVTVNTTGLLLFMPGLTETAKYPEIAPSVIVIVIDVSLHEFTVIAASLSHHYCPVKNRTESIG